MTSVYFIQAGGAHGDVKIGFASNVKRRLAALQTGNSLRLTLLLSIVASPRLGGHRHLEERLHRHLGHLRVGQSICLPNLARDSEWFAWGPEIAELIAAFRLADPTTFQHGFVIRRKNGTTSLDPISLPTMDDLRAYDRARDEFENTDGGAA